VEGGFQVKLSTLLRRGLCRIGRHRWEMEIYMSIGSLWCEGDVCRDCRSIRKRRRSATEGASGG
jgi:hypothetical protein